MHTNSITMMDKKLRTIAAKRYEKHLKDAHQLLFDYYDADADEIFSINGKFKW